MEAVPINLDLALSDYLSGPDGSIRYIRGLQELARDAILYGFSLSWTRVPRGWQPYEELTGGIEFGPGTYRLQPWELRRAWAEAMAARIVGGPLALESVERWVREHYGELVMQPESAA